ncbi:hypothetical protein D8674_013236 [Pyrus ussuriensis x Pyrus communis]|uniref:Reverse transcriptase domain-containing protein n=1 Tax=Pyrus ussuriensis x Pyrus communis TaxID=2448454 RepID=A0A5N5GQF0_9ROSA|nr:hypothetical protein D8674_013236 [Pyrus ussuriensis x Pyrus communis]
MAPRSRRNTTKSGNALDADEKGQENLDEYDISDIIVTIYALGEAQKEIFTTVKELKNSILKPSEKASVKDYTSREKCSQEKLVAALGKGPEKTPSFEELAAKFCKKYFQHEERVMTTQLNNMRKKYGEDPMTFVKRFRDLAHNFYDENDKEALVEICSNDIVTDYKVYLENIGISQFSRFLEVVRKTSLTFLENNNAIIFTDEDMKVAFLDHQRPLYLKEQINDIIIRSQISNNGFGNNSKRSIRYIEIDLKIDPVRIGLRPIRISGNQMPFNLDEVHYSDVDFYNDFSSAGSGRAMTSVFHDIMGMNVEDYVDDLIVKSKTREGHWEVLRKMLRRCRAYGLKMNPKKCAFGVSSSKFLRFLVHQRSINVDPDKVLLGHIPGITNRYVDALATFSFKLTVVEEQLNIVVIRMEASTIDVAFPKEVLEDDDWREIVKKEFSKPSRELNIKYLKEYINVVGTLYKRLSGGVLT